MNNKIKSLLVVSNGHGEDIIAATVIRQVLAQDPDIWAEAIPLVGEGSVYNGLPVKVLAKSKDMPSGGFARQSLQMLWQDLKAGLLSLTAKQRRAVKRAGADADLCLVVGDIYALWMAGKVDCPIAFMPTAKSEYISGHFKLEKRYMARKARLVFPRDGLTAEDLRQNGVKAEYLGNVMMDTFQVSGDSLFAREADAVVGILPGSRDEAYANMLEVLKAIELMENLAKKELTYGVALAGRLDFQQLACQAGELGWELEGPRNIRGHLGRLAKDGAEVNFYQGRFGDLLEQADIFIGLAGTANEQA
ncbi:MAG: lipid-A-disaccharide synthase-related protein, partial [Halanaerobium sp.]|nr:lipid-A-disaccharide synthase-related protein [Halanaerobium sp.]